MRGGTSRKPRARRRARIHPTPRPELRSALGEGPCRDLPGSSTVLPVWEVAAVTVSVHVPWRLGCRNRDAARQWVSARWAKHSAKPTAARLLSPTGTFGHAPSSVELAVANVRAGVRPWAVPHWDFAPADRGCDRYGRPARPFTTRCRSSPASAAGRRRRGVGHRRTHDRRLPVARPPPALPSQAPAAAADQPAHRLRAEQRAVGPLHVRRWRPPDV